MTMNTKVRKKTFKYERQVQVYDKTWLGYNISRYG